MGAGSAVFTGDPIAFVNVGASASITGEACVAGAVKAPDHIAARGVSVAVMGPVAAFIHIGTGALVSRVTRGARAGSQAAIIVNFIFVVAGFATVDHPIPAGSDHASGSAGVRVGVRVGGALVADLPAAFVQNPIPAALIGAIGVAKVGLAALVAGFSGVNHLITTTSHAAICPASVRERIGVVGSCVAGLPCFDLAVSADRGHAFSGVLIADKEVPAGGAGRGFLNRNLAGTEKQ
jgi:hypothetical protein